MEIDADDTVSQSIEAVRMSLQTIDREFSAALAQAEKARHLLQMRRLGSTPTEVEVPRRFEWLGGPTSESADDQLVLLYDVLQSKRSDIGYVLDLIEEIVWLIANGRLEPDNTTVRPSF